MDVGGYQIVDFRHGTITGSDVLELAYTQDATNLEKVIERLEEVARVNVPVMFNNININVTGQSPISMTDLSVYGYRFTDKLKKVNYEFITSYGVFNFVVNGNKIKVTLK